MTTDPMVIQIKSNGRGVVQPPPPQPVGEWRTLIYLLGGLLGLVLLIALALYMTSYFASSSQETSEETAQLISNVSALMLLPADEQPTVATVTNLDSLKDQVFFKNARIGDRVLMYPKNKKAILYSPTENRIIEVAPITFDETI